ncbi:DUF4132 domain-containing protein [Mycobacteroides abscessus]|uniref:DUF4132 domain-containing protein n=1 Tax=Mycobacteroides abscessus TaxID=36809 RepID=UPI00148F671F|nr:DUF4132 domain-containing protein [Mycobacteroides abscessus]
MTDGFLRELEAHGEVRLGLPAANALGMLRDRWVFIGQDHDVLRALIEELSKDREYLEFARRILTVADSRLAAIHAGTEPFIADKAFSADDARVIERAALVALSLDADWAEPIPRILWRAAIAPQVAAKSAPSQAAAFALARAIMVAPTPESVGGLADTTRDVRHAGIKKKFTRYIKEARRALAGRPDVALRLPFETTPTKAQLTTWTKSLEAGWLVSASWSYQTWIDAAFAVPVASISANLVWQVVNGPAFLGSTGDFADAAGHPVTVSAASRIRLWHPAAAAPAERDAWRLRIRNRQLVQPFAQVFREHYASTDADRLVAGHAVLNVLQLTGLYRAEGWTSEGHETISRRAGAVAAEMWFDGSVYPGSGLETCSAVGLRVGALGIAADGSGTIVADGCHDLPAVSEIIRSADLILSASTVAVESASESGHSSTQSPAGVLATRRVILEHVLAEIDSAAPIRITQRHIEVNGFRISLATGRVTRDGDPVDITPRKRHGLWQPESDQLLTTIVGTVVAVLDCGA